MAIDAGDLSRFSQGLLGPDATEVELRAASSRAYYAAYHGLLWLADLLPPSEQCDERSRHIGHRELGRRISEWKTESLNPRLGGLKVVKKDVCIALEASRVFRETCDYRLDRQITFTQARAQVERARRILRHVEQFRAAVVAETELRVGWV